MRATGCRVFEGVEKDENKAILESSVYNCKYKLKCNEKARQRQRKKHP